MKHLKKICAICIAAQLGAISINTQAYETFPESVTDIRVNIFLDQYFNERENDFIDSKPSAIQEINAQSNDVELSFSEMRSCLISKMEEKLDLSIVSSDTTYSISDMSIENNFVYLDVYEWTNVEYTGDSGLVDMFGYGVDHKMVLEKSNDTYCLVSDTYDEGPLTGMSSSLSYNEFLDLVNAEYPDYDVCQGQPNSTQSETESISAQSASGYNPYKVAEYANKWVSHSANGGEEKSYYNTAQYATNGDADCTNYVSQCMYAGGVKMDSSSDANGWWYDPNQNCPWSSVWFTATPHFEYFKATYTSYTDVTDDSKIIPGNPVYYNWQNSSDDYNKFNHAAICVGYDSSGDPIVNSHTDDYYHVKWNYGYPATRYGTVKITNDDVLNTPSGAATLVAKTSYNAKLETTTDVDCFKFKALESKTYTVATRGDTDTYGKLYNSSGTLLSSNDNGGTANNFKIAYNLTAGNTYYIYVSSSKSSSGFYGLKIV